MGNICRIEIETIDDWVTLLVDKLETDSALTQDIVVFPPHYEQLPGYVIDELLTTIGGITYVKMSRTDINSILVVHRISLLTTVTFISFITIRVSCMTHFRLLLSWNIHIFKLAYFFLVLFSKFGLHCGCPFLISVWEYMRITFNKIFFDRLYVLFLNIFSLKILTCEKRMRWCILSPSFVSIN